MDENEVILTKRTINTWKREFFLDVGDIWSESDVWSCPDCAWAVTLESYEDFDVDAPVEHGYKFCPHCGARRITE